MVLISQKQLQIHGIRARASCWISYFCARSCNTELVNIAAAVKSSYFPVWHKSWCYKLGLAF